MKRTSERYRESFRTSKRFRRLHLSDQHTKSLNDISAETYEPPFEGHLERRTATEVYQNAENSLLEGYLDLKVFMRWHIPGDKFRIHGESREGGLASGYLMPGGEGWKSIIRVRMLHAVARRRARQRLQQVGHSDEDRNALSPSAVIFMVNSTI